MIIFSFFFSFKHGSPHANTLQQMTNLSWLLSSFSGKIRLDILYELAHEMPSIRFFNPFMPKGFSHLNQLVKFISNFMVVGWNFSFLFKF